MYIFVKLKLSPRIDFREKPWALVRRGLDADVWATIPAEIVTRALSIIPVNIMPVPN